MFVLGPFVLVVILAILLLIFGASRLPKLARSAGESASEFQKGLKGESKEPEKKPSSRKKS